MNIDPESSEEDNGRTENEPSRDSERGGLEEIVSDAENERIESSKGGREDSGKS